MIEIAEGVKVATSASSMVNGGLLTVTGASFR